MDKQFFKMSHHNSVTLLKDGQMYQKDYLSLIKNAKKTIHLQTYIFMIDDFGILVRDELIAASERGVKIYLLLDSIGSRLLDLKSENKLREAGVIVERFNKIQFIWPQSWGRRLHHKILLIDEEFCIIGGINVQGVTPSSTKTQQLDFALLIKGPVLSKLTLYCQFLFFKSSHKKIHFAHHKRPETLQDFKGVDCKILINDWVYRRWQISRQYAHLTKKAKNEITIINSYFFPRKIFMKQLVEAAARGVRVRLILPKFSDWSKYILASEFLYSYFLKNGVEIYLWKNSILHGKIATIDGKFTTVGSFNLNYTSYQQNLEMNVNIYSKTFTQDVQKEIEWIIENGCEKLDPKIFIEKATFIKRFERFFYYIVLAFIANFSIALTYQENSKSPSKVANKIRIGSSMVFLLLGAMGILYSFLPSIILILLGFILLIQQLFLNKKRQGP
jgi:cardiolipin synthase